MTEVLCVGILVIVLAVVVSWAIFKRRRLEESRTEAWSAFAREHGYRFLAEEGSWLRRRRSRVEGRSAAVDFTLELHVVRRGKHTVTYTRISGRGAGNFSGAVSVRGNGFFAKCGRALGMSFRESGDRTFDERFAVRAASDEDALAVLADGSRRAMLAFPRRFELTCKGTGATLMWRAREADPAVLEAGCEVVAAVCNARAKSSRGVSAAT